MDYPFFDKNADQIEYDRWHGYSLMDKEGRTPEYAFGHGLSYSVFKYRALKARRVPGGINVSVSVCNEGTMRADEIVQAYIRPPGKAVERSARQLCGFERVTIEPGETRTVHLFIRDADISFWNETSGTWQPETGRHLVEVGAYSADSACRTIAVDL